MSNTFPIMYNDLVTTYEEDIKEASYPLIPDHLKRRFDEDAYRMDRTLPIGQENVE